MGIDSLKVELGRIGSWNASWNFLEFSSVLSCEHGPLGGEGEQERSENLSIMIIVDP